MAPTSGRRQCQEIVCSPPFVDFYDDGGTSLSFVLSNDVGRDSSGPGYVTAFDRDSGTEQWTEQRSPLALFARNIGDTLYCTFGRETSELVSLDAESGTENWADEREDDRIWGFAYPGSGDSVYVDASRTPDNAPTEGELVKFGSDGSRIWTYDAGAQIRGITSVNSTVYIATADGRVESINDNSSSDNYGENGWSKDLGSEITNAGLNLAGGILYTGVTSDPGTVFALSADDGSELDSYTLDSGITGTVIPSDGRVWVTGSPESLTDGDSAIYALGEDGQDNGDGGGGGEEWYSEYVNENGVVDTSGLRAGISDWRSGDVSTDRLRTLIASWRSGDPIDQ